MNSTTTSTTAPDTLASALAKFQARVPRIAKGETAHVRSDKGNYSYTYADLADISAVVMPLLGEHGLSFTARPTFTEGRFVLAYSLLHTSGEREDGEYPLPASGSPQAIGSAITYARRYTLCAVTGVAPDDEDDDAAAAEVSARRSNGQHSRAAAPAQESGPRMVDKRQLAAIGAGLKDIGITDREPALALVAEVIGREIGSRSELTYAEAARVVSATQQRHRDTARRAAAQAQDDDAAAEAPQDDGDQLDELRARAARIAAAHENGSNQ